MLKAQIRSVIIYLITAALLVLVIQRVGPDELLATLMGGKPGFVLLSLISAQVIIFLNVFKWQILLRSRGYDISVFHLWKLCLVGVFFNNFLPTNVGGDVVRGYELGKQIQNSPLALASVFVERFTGFVVLVGLNAVSFVALTQYRVTENPMLAATLLFAVVGLAIAAWLVLDRRLLSIVVRRARWRLAVKYLTKFEKFQQAIHEFRQDRSVLLRAILLSCVYYVGIYGYVYYSMLAFHEDVWFLGVALVVPITNLVAFVPLTFNGIGLTELAYVLLFPMIGVPAPAALSAIVLIRANTAISSLIGGLLYSRMRADSAATAVSPVSLS